MDPGAMAKRWSEVLATQTKLMADGAHEMELERGRLRFVSCDALREEGLAAVEIEALDRRTALRAAAARGLEVEGDGLMLCATRIRLVDPA